MNVIGITFDYKLHCGVQVVDLLKESNSRTQAIQHVWKVINGCEPESKTFERDNRTTQARLEECHLKIDSGDKWLDLILTAV